MTNRAVTVVGLGRMGTAMARRLDAEGWDVRGWHRRGAPVEAVTVVPDLAGAVAGADVVLLSLFDDAACDDVLGRLRPVLAAGVVIVNTTTTSRAAAVRFADLMGPDYVHCPVLGSVPAVGAGGLTLIPGGDPVSVEAVLPLLRTLGQPVQAADAATSSTLKLIANGALAGGLAVVRDALRQADALALDRGVVLDLLQRGPVGGLVRSKRDRLAAGAPARPADFTVAGLAKDQGLLAELSGSPWPLARQTQAALASAQVRPDDDIAALATAPEPDRTGVLEPLLAYIEGHATGDPAHFARAFLPSAHIEGIRDGAFVSWTLPEYQALFPGHPAADEARRTRRIDELVVAGTIASAVMTLHHGTDTFTDIFLLVDTGAGWRIANKVYNRALA